MSHDLSTSGSPAFQRLLHQFRAGEISRRDFLAQGIALGVGGSVLGWFVRGVQTTAAAPVRQESGSQPPAVGTEGKTRGQDGELKVLLWQAVTQLSPHQSTGTKDLLGAQFIVEPLMQYLPDGSLWPNLVTEVPTIANGGLSEDLTRVTLRLRPGVVWSDGTPFTANDVVFTHAWVTNPENNAVSVEAWRRITGITAVDELTVEVEFARPNLTWYSAFTGYELGPIYPRHYIEANGNDIMNSAPIGTGPYVLSEFYPNDQVIYTVNETYRDPNRPFFSRVNLKGGGDAATAARSVLQIGDWDYAWNLQVEPEVIAEYERGGQGTFRVIPGTAVERINLNFSDPDLEGPDGQRSWYEFPHAILSDPAVRQAVNLAVDRDLIAERFYDPRGEVATANTLAGIPPAESPNTSYQVNADEAARILDAAGWVLNGDVREKDGQRLELGFVSTINSVRQKTQAVVKQNLERIGFRIALTETDSTIFFDGSPGTTQNLNHMYHDMNMFSSGPSNPTPIDYMINWYAGPDRENIAQASNNWTGQNVQRYINQEYDALWEELRSGQVTDLEEFYQGLIRLNDILIADVVVVPLVHRASSNKYAIHNSLIHGEGETAEDNLGSSAFEGVFWNVGNWNRR